MNDYYPIVVLALIILIPLTYRKQPGFIW